MKNRFTAQLYYLLILATIVVVGTCTASRAADASFTWLPNTEADLAGYKIHYGPGTRNYTDVVDVGMPDPIDGRIHFTIDPVPDGETFFAATAYDSKGNESDYSDELSFDPPPGSVKGLQVVNVTATLVSTE